MRYLSHCTDYAQTIELLDFIKQALFTASPPTLAEDLEMFKGMEALFVLLLHDSSDIRFRALLVLCFILQNPARKFGNMQYYFNIIGEALSQSNPISILCACACVN